jgi:hypothetical protein
MKIKSYLTHLLGMPPVSPSRGRIKEGGVWNKKCNGERASPCTPSMRGAPCIWARIILYNENKILFNTLTRYATSISLWRENERGRNY